MSWVKSFYNFVESANAHRHPSVQYQVVDTHMILIGLIAKKVQRTAAAPIGVNNSLKNYTNQNPKFYFRLV